MGKKKMFFILLAVFVAVIIAAAVLYGIYGDAPLPGNIASQGEQEPVSAPDFTVYDADGNAVHLSDFRGKPVVLNFWASWCGPCKMEMPDFQAKYEELGDSVEFMMVNATDGGRETVDTAQAFLEEVGYSFPVYFDSDYEANYAYGVTGLPTTFFINAEGYVEAYAPGAIPADLLQQGIDMILE